MKLELTKKETIKAELGDVIVDSKGTYLIIKQDIFVRVPEYRESFGERRRVVGVNREQRTFYHLLDLKTNKLFERPCGSIKMLIEKYTKNPKIIKADNLKLSADETCSTTDKDEYKNWF